MIAAAVVAAGMTFAVLMVVVAAFYIGVIVQHVYQKCLYRTVSIAADTAVNLDAICCQSVLLRNLRLYLC